MPRPLSAIRNDFAVVAEAGRSVRAMIAELSVRRGAAALVVAAALLGSCAATRPTEAPTSAQPAATAAPTTPSAAIRPAGTPKTDASPTPWATNSAGAVLVPGGQTGRISTPDQNYALTIPDGWRTLPVDGELGQAEADAFAGIPPADLQLWRSTLAGAGADLVAVDIAAAKDGKIVGLYVARVPIGVEQNLDSYAAQVADAIGKLQGVTGSVDRKPEALAGGPAYRPDVPAAARGSWHQPQCRRVPSDLPHRDGPLHVRRRRAEPLVRSRHV